MNALLASALTLAATASLLAAAAGYVGRRENLKRLAATCPAALQYLPLADKWASVYGIPAEWILATIVVESCGNAQASGDQGRSYGLMQVNATAHASRLARHKLTASDLYDPNANIMIGTEILRELVDAIRAVTPDPPLRLDLLVRQAYRGPAATLAALRARKSPVVYADTVAAWERTLARGRALV